MCHLSCFFTVSPSDCVTINSISAPQSYRNGQANSVVLDCDFSIDPEKDDLLVVKWFLNDEKQHIYQWIQSKDMRIYSPKIKPYVDETFVVSDHPTRHRALRLLNPPAILSGKYTCSVQSLNNEDSNSTHLIIYGKAPTSVLLSDCNTPFATFFYDTTEPAKAFDIAAVEVDEERPDEDGFNITCTALGVYPEPEIKLYKVRSNKENLEAKEVETNGTTILSFVSVIDGFYSLTLTSHIEQTNDTITNNLTTDSEELAELESPARERLALTKQNQTKEHNIAEHYECRLTIPHSNYVAVRRLAIQEGKCYSVIQTKMSSICNRFTQTQKPLSKLIIKYNKKMLKRA